MNEVTLEARPYIVIWSVLFLVYLLGVMYYFWKKHPETFDSNSDPELKQKYQQRLLISFTMIFVWIAGIEVIYSLVDVATATSWFIFGFALFGMLVPVLGIIKNSQTCRPKSKPYTTEEIEAMDMHDYHCNCNDDGRDDLDELDDTEVMCR